MLSDDEVVLHNITECINGTSAILIGLIGGESRRTETVGRPGTS